MGCDIHWFSETKKDGQWVCDQANTFTNDEEDGADMDSFTDRGRDYWLFGLLNPNCGRGGDYYWAFNPSTEIPDDVSQEILTIHKQWGSDAHSAGCVYGNQIKDKVEELKVVFTELLITPNRNHVLEAAQHHSQRLTQIIQVLGDFAPLEDRRIVFWFDN